MRHDPGFDSDIAFFGEKCQAQKPLLIIAEDVEQEAV